MGWSTQIIAKNFRLNEKGTLTWDEFNNYNNHITLCEYNKSYFLERWICKILKTYSYGLDDSGWCVLELKRGDIDIILSKIKDGTFKKDFYDEDKGYEHLNERHNQQQIKEFTDAMKLAKMLMSNSYDRYMKIFVVAG